MILTIGGVKWNVVHDPKVNGGAFFWKDHTIKYGKMSKERRINVLIHEVCEIIMVNQVVRYEKCLSEVGNSDYLFIMDHDQFSVFADELSGVIKEIYARA